MNNSLNPKLWSPEGTLKKEVRNKLIEIVDAFKEFLDFPVDFIDVHLVGSNASYNYTDTSDLDVHVIVNFDRIPATKDLTQLLFNLKKKSFNDNFDINIKGINIELYVEDVGAGTTSNGIYSLYKDRWVKTPTLENVQDIDIDINEELKYYRDTIYSAIFSDDVILMNKVLDDMYLMRKNALAVDGEKSKGNLIFKALRNEGLLDNLKETIKRSTSKKLSLENLRKKGQLKL